MKTVKSYNRVISREQDRQERDQVFVDVIDLLDLPLRNVTVSELIRLVKEWDPDKDLPRHPVAFGKKLKELQPQLLDIGIRVKRSSDGKNRCIHLTRVADDDAERGTKPSRKDIGFKLLELVEKSVEQAKSIGPGGESSLFSLYFNPESNSVEFRQVYTKTDAVGAELSKMVNQILV